MAGLLSSLGRSVWNAVDPLVPDEQVMGLLGRARGLGAPPAGPAFQPPGSMTPGTAPMPTQRQTSGLGSVARVPGALVGAILNDLESGPRRARMQDEQYAQLQQRHQEIDATIQDPRERLTAHANLEEWSKNNATRYGAHNVAGGNSLVMGEPGRPGSSIYNAPKYGESDGRGYSVTPQGIAALGELPETYDMRTDRMKAETDASGYTLGPGARRYGADNQLLAAAPFSPQYREVGPGQSLVALGGDEGSPAPSYQQVAAAITSAIPGARVTSGLRSPEDNARVNGVANSQHMSGTALDLVPPPGVPMEQFAQQLRSTVPPGTEIIPEGDHVHIEWGGRAGGNGGGARVVAQGGPKPGSRPATASEKAVYGIPENVPAQIGPDGKIDVISLPKGADPAKQEQAAEARRYQAQTVLRTVKSARERVGIPTSGFIGGNTAGIKGSPAYNLARDIETIKANLGFDRLQEMRDNSPTGGALGQVAVQELEALQATIANLDIGQSPDQLGKNLDAVERHYSQWLAAVEQSQPPSAARSGGSPQARSPSADRGGVPDAAIQLLRQNPSLAAKFDEKYGNGAAARVLGR